MKQRNRIEGIKLDASNVPILGLSSEFMTMHYILILYFLPVTYTVVHIYVALYLNNPVL